MSGVEEKDIDREIKRSSGSVEGNYSPGKCKNKAGLEAECPKVYVKVTGNTLSDYASGAVLMYDGKTGLTDTSWKDQSGHNNHVTLESEIEKATNSIKCSGKDVMFNSYAKVGNLFYKKVTLESTFIPNFDDSNPRTIVSNEENGGYELMVKNEKASFQIWKGNDYVNTPYISTPKGVKNYISGAGDSNMVKAYVNGKHKYTQSSGEVGKPHYDEPIVICANPNYYKVNEGRPKKVDQEYFKGYVYSVRLYNKVLTNDEMQKNYVIDKSRFNY